MLGKALNFLGIVLFLSLFSCVIAAIKFPCLALGIACLVLWVATLCAMPLADRYRYLSLDEVRDWCRAAHGEQKYGEHPYDYHLKAVEAVAVRFGFTSFVIRMACWAHDVLEDTKRTREDMRDAGVPAEVVDIAYCVTDEPGANRQERKKKTLPKIAANRKAIIVKLCDRIANTEEAKQNHPKKFATYKSEFPEFEKALRNRADAEVEPMWLHLESLYAA